MNHGSMSMNWKQRPSRSNGSCLFLHTPRRCSKVQEDQDHVNCGFLIGKMLSIRSIPPQTKQLMNITSVFFIHWEIQWKWLQLWAPGDWQLHHNNAPAHASCLMQSFLTKHQITQVTQPPYSPDLVPCDFLLFPKLKPPLKGKRFQTINEIQENIMGQVMVIGRTVWGPNVSALKGTEMSLSYVQCFLYLVSF